MKSPLRFRLFFGPYAPPRAGKGNLLFCEVRGTVKVGSWSQGRIPWPRWRSGLILCGDLVRAVKQEASETVAFHWGVSIGTVSRWRKCLNVEEMNPGTLRLRKQPSGKKRLGLPGGRQEK